MHKHAPHAEHAPSHAPHLPTATSNPAHAFPCASTWSGTQMENMCRPPTHPHFTFLNMQVLIIGEKATQALQGEVMSVPRSVPPLLHWTWFLLLPLLCGRCSIGPGSCCVVPLHIVLGLLKAHGLPASAAPLCDRQVVCAHHIRQHATARWQCTPSPKLPAPSRLRGLPCKSPPVSRFRGDALEKRP